MKFRRQGLKKNFRFSNVMRRFIQTGVISVAFFAGMMTNEFRDNVHEFPITTVVASEITESVGQDEMTNDIEKCSNSDTNVMSTIVSNELMTSTRPMSTIDSALNVGLPGVDAFSIYGTNDVLLSIVHEEPEPPMIEPEVQTEVNIEEPPIEVEEVEPIVEEPELPDIHISFEDITVTSNATREQIAIALEGTWLEEYSDLYYDLEQQYGINAFLAIATAIQETGWKGTSRLAVEKNNIYGVRNGEYESKEECIRYYFDFMSRLYISKGYISMDKINTKYCPPDDTWCTDIYSIAMKLNNKVMATFT